MSKDTREFIHKDGVLPWDGVELQPDKLNIHAIAYTLTQDSEDTSVRFFLERNAIENTIRAGESVSEDEAVALVGRIRNLYLSDSFDWRVYLPTLLAGQCLKLKEGQTTGEVFTVMAMLKAKNPPPAIPEWRGPMSRQIINIAVPAELKVAFGVESARWLYDRSEDFARDCARKGCTHGSTASRLFDGGDFEFIPDREICSQPEPSSIPVVPAPNEVTIAEYIDLAESSPDHWDALVKATAILRRSRQPFGEALSDWLIMTAVGKPNASRRSSWASSPPPASSSRCIASTWKARAPTRPTSNPARPASGVPPEARSAWAASLSTGGCSLARASNRPRRRWRCSTFRVGRPSNANRLTLRQAFKDFADFPNGEFDKLTGADAGDANGDGKQGRPVEWDGPEPWSESVDGAALLDALVVLLERYASQPDGGAVAVALWALYTRTFRAFAVAPNLMITAPERESGKTRVTELLSWAVPRGEAGQ